jgi:hypothetical protein
MGTTGDALAAFLQSCEKNFRKAFFAKIDNTNTTFFVFNDLGSIH